jgi:hypothetical protein
VADLNRQYRDLEPEGGAAAYTDSGHPSVERLMAEQGTAPITDVSMLHGDFWPEEESIEDFLETLQEWRGHRRTHPAA